VSSLTTIVRAPNQKFVYALSGFQDDKVVELAVGSDGKLYGQNTYSLTGTYPLAMTIDPAGKFLYVTFKYQTGFTPALPGPGGITVFPINADNTLGTPLSINGLSYIPVGSNPVSIAISVATCGNTAVIPGSPACTGPNGASNSNVFVYVVDQEAPPNATVLGFAQDQSTGALTPLSGTSYNQSLGTWYGISAGVTPSAIAVDPTGRFVYVTDQTSNQVLGYTIDTNGTGNLTAMNSSPFGAGLYPVALTVDPRGKYLYTVNYNSGTVSSFAIDQSVGSLSALATAGSFAVGSSPTCITIDPELGIYVYTSNYLLGSLSAGKLNANTGAITTIPDSPFTVSSLPSCVTSVASGALYNVQVNP
jgi:6-phosphogluconolactonase (cycloisomerase 2 family)